MSPNQITGQKWEMYAAQQLRARGYKVKMHPDFNQPSHDLTTNGLVTEVKYASATYRRYTLKSGQVVKYPRWQWRFSPVRRDEDWIVVLIANDGDRLFHFIVPGQLINDRLHIQITSHPGLYTGWLSNWLEQWELVHFLAEKLYKGKGTLTYQDWLLTVHPAAIDCSRELASKRLEGLYTPPQQGVSNG